LLNFGSDVKLRLVNSETWLTVRKFVKLDDSEFAKASGRPNDDADETQS